MTPFHRSISNSVFPHPNPPDSSGGRAYTFNKLNGSLDVSGGLTFYTIGTHCWLDWNWQCTSSVQLIWEFTVYQNSTFNQAQRETAIKRRQNISVPDPLPPLSLSPRCRLTFLVHFSFRFFSFLKQWERMVSHLAAHTAPFRHKALLQSYICSLSPVKGALTPHRHQAFYQKNGRLW